MRTSQKSFFPALKMPTGLSHGGEKSKGKRKTLRPLDTKRPVHLILKSTRARGSWSMLHPKHRTHVETWTRKIAKQRGIRIFRYANVGNHIHLLVQTPTRRAFQAFLRQLAGALAMLITGSRKGNPGEGRFWDQLAWSRVVSWGRDFKGVMTYLIKNLFQAEGLLTKADLRAGVRVISMEFDPPPKKLGKNWNASTSRANPKHGHIPAFILKC